MTGNPTFGGSSDGNFGEVELGTAGVGKGWTIKSKNGVGDLRIISVDGIGALPFEQVPDTKVRICAPLMKLTAANTCQLRVRANTKLAGEWGLDPLLPREIVVVVQENNGTARQTVRISLKIKVKVKTGWVRQLGGSDRDFPVSTSIDSSGNVFLAGYTDGSFEDEQNKGGSDAFIAKLDTSGKIAWKKQLGGSRNDFLASTSIDSSGNVFLAGYTFSSFEGERNKGNQDVFITKLETIINSDGSQSGKIAWKKQLGGSDYDNLHSTSIDSSGNVFLTGYTYGSFEGEQNKGQNDAFIAKLDTSGNIVWKKQLGGSDYDFPVSTSIDSSGNVFLAGYTFGSFEGERNKGEHDVFIAKIETIINSDGSQSGNIAWKKQLGGSDSDDLVSTSIDSSGNVFLTGYTYGSFEGEQNKGGSDTFIAKLDTSGNIIWKKQLGGSGEDYAISTLIDGPGNVFLTGTTTGSFEGAPNKGGYIDSFIAKLDTSGNIVWKEQLGGSGIDYPHHTLIDSSGNVFLAGKTSDSFEGEMRKDGFGTFILKLITKLP